MLSFKEFKEGVAKFAGYLRTTVKQVSDDGDGNYSAVINESDAFDRNLRVRGRASSRVLAINTNNGHTYTVTI